MKQSLLLTLLSICFALLLCNKLIAAPATLPINEISAGGASWTYLYSNSSDGFRLADASFMGLNDAYDGMFSFTINGTLFDVGGSVDSSDFVTDYTTAGKKFTSDQIDIGSDLMAQQQYLFFTNPVNGLPTVRSLLKITNNGVADQNVQVITGGNLGSDGDTTTVATSSGDLTIDNNDFWVITADNAVAPLYDPPVTMVFGSSSFVGNPAYTSLNYSGDGLNVQYDFTVPAGQTRYVIIFGQLSSSLSDSTNGVEIFSNIDKLFLSAMAFNDLNEQQLGQIVNWPSLDSSPRKAIGDFIWFDTNGNGVQDVGEPGLNGIKVDIYSNAGLLLASRTTNSSGNYQFSYLASGSYYLQVSSASGVPFLVSPKGQGGDAAKDSDINSDFKTDVFTFDGLNDNLTIDGGLTTTPPIDYNDELRKLISNNHYRVLALLRSSSAKQKTALRNASNNMLQYIRNNVGKFNLIQGANILKLGQSARIAIRTLLAQFSNPQKARAIKALRALRRSLN